MARTPIPCARKMAISSRSVNERRHPDRGFDDCEKCVGGMPPAFRNHRTPTAGDTPASTLASSLERPEAIAAQNCLQFSRCASGGRPGDRKAACTHRSGRLYLFIATSLPKCCDDRLNPPWIARSSRATTASTRETSRPEHPGQAGEVSPDRRRVLDAAGAPELIEPSGNAEFRS